MAFNDKDFTDITALMGLANLTAELAGLTAERDSVVAGYDARIAALRDRIGDALQALGFARDASVVRVKITTETTAEGLDGSAATKTTVPPEFSP